jgi:hypothetical protein
MVFSGVFSVDDIVSPALPSVLTALPSPGWLQEQRISIIIRKTKNKANLLYIVNSIMYVFYIIICEYMGLNNTRKCDFTAQKLLNHIYY